MRNKGYVRMCMCVRLSSWREEQEGSSQKTCTTILSTARPHLHTGTCKEIHLGPEVCSSNSSPILLLQKGPCLDPALQFANKLTYQKELVASQQNKVNSFWGFVSPVGLSFPSTVSQRCKELSRQGNIQEPERLTSYETDDKNNQPKLFCAW